MGVTFRWYGDRVMRNIQRGLNGNLRAACEFLTDDIKRSFHDPRIPAGFGGRRERSKPGEIPYVDTATLRRAVGWLIKKRGFLSREMMGKVGVFKELVKRNPDVAKAILYAGHLEVGTHKMAKRPWARPSLDRNRRKLALLLGRPIR